MLLGIRCLEMLTLLKGHCFDFNKIEISIEPSALSNVHFAGDDNL